MKQNFLGKGWKYPISIDFNKEIALATDEKDIQEAILIILGTSKGERIMRPDFGCDIHEMVFSSLNSATITLMLKSIQEALVLWEPRIDLLKVEADDEKANYGKIIFDIEYIVRTTNNRFNMVYPFYLREEI